MSQKMSNATQMIAVLLNGIILVACDPNNVEEVAEVDVEEVQYLFVQSAKGLETTGDTITLKGVSPNTIYFSDRPYRIAGHMLTEVFVDQWSEGEDSFSIDNPNATLSVFGEEDVSEIVVVLSNPQLNGDDFSYDVEVLEGTIPSDGGECSLFIDVIGRPLTPLSVAGVARRNVRRDVIYR